MSAAVEERATRVLLGGSEVEERVLATMMARGVWESRTGRATGWDDLSDLSREVQIDTAARHLVALREFLA